jgi:RNAse (barnase) inhibitor barstar
LNNCQDACNPERQFAPITIRSAFEHMAAFTQQDAYDAQIDWWILRDGSIAPYGRREYLDEDVHWLRRQNYQVFAFDCGQWSSGEKMHADFKQTLASPEYYLDRLDDVAVPEVGGIVVAFRHFDKAAAPPTASGRPEVEIVLDIMARASRHFLLTGRRFLRLVQTEDAQLRFDHLGLCIRLLESARVAG